MKFALIILSIFSITLFSASVFAEPYISLDKSSYRYDDMVRVSGNVEYQKGMVVVIQLRSPSDIVAIDQIFPARSGKFSVTFEAQGPKWQESGTYTVLISYDGQKTEKTFQFSKPTPITEPVKSQPAQELQTKQNSVEPQKTKITVKDFPDPNKSPQYYYDRYNTESDYKSWFDSTFAGHTIQDVVGYKPTHIPGFPDQLQSPQYYIDRYNNETRFREWFDQQFPEQTIYDIVGVTEQKLDIVPAWIKQYARMWSNEEIDDSHFIDGISELLKQNIIEVSGNIIKENNPDKSIPFWFKTNASWYSQDMITEDDFLLGIQYLIEKEIIVI